MMKKILLSLTIVFGSVVNLNAQMKVGANPTTIDPSAMLQVDAAGNRGGILIPRVTLSATNVAAPCASHVAGMIVYNTATAGTAPVDVTPGFYYNDGTKWVKLINQNDPIRNYTWLISGSNRDGYKVGDQDSLAWRKGYSSIGNLFTNPNNSYFFNPLGLAHNNVLSVQDSINDAQLTANTVVNGVNSELAINSNLTSGVAALRAANNRVILKGNLSSGNNIYGTFGSVVQMNNGTTTNRTIGLAGSNLDWSGTGTRNLMIGTEGRLELYNTASSTIIDAICLNAQNSGNSSVVPTNLYGIKYTKSTNVVPTNGYGLYLDDVAGSKKWALYTNAGKNSMGDTLQLRKDVINATSDSVLVVDGAGHVGRRSSSTLPGTQNYAWLLTGTNRTANMVGDQDSIVWRTGYSSIGNLFTHPNNSYFFNPLAVTNNNVLSVQDSISDSKLQSYTVVNGVNSELAINSNLASGVAALRAANNRVVLKGNLSSGNNIYGTFGSVVHMNNGTTTNRTIGLVGTNIDFGGTGTRTLMIGTEGRLELYNTSASTITNAICLHAQNSGNSSVVPTNLYGFKYTKGTNVVPTNGYGLYLDDIEGTNKWAVYTNAGKVSVGDNMEMRGNGYFKVATGTTSQRPATAEAGMIRFNTTTSKFEGYDGTNWVDLN